MDAGVADREGKQTDAIVRAEHYLTPGLSPDGTRLAVTLFAGAQGTSDVWISIWRGKPIRDSPLDRQARLGPSGLPMGRRFFMDRTIRALSYLCQGGRWERRRTAGSGRGGCNGIAEAGFTGRTLLDFRQKDEVGSRFPHLGIAVKRRR